MSDLITVNFKGYDINIVVEDYTPGYSAKLNALPENCYPGEPPEADFIIETGNDLLDELLEENHRDAIDELVLEVMAQKGIDAKNEYFSEKYAEMKEERWIE